MGGVKAWCDGAALGRPEGSAVPSKAFSRSSQVKTAPVPAACGAASGCGTNGPEPHEPPAPADPEPTGLPA
eukprot:1851707-Rhodomonas_salina.1